MNSVLGPCMIKDTKGLGAKTVISVFVCFATKCIYSEMISDLTTEVFLVAFRDFVFRSIPSHIYSDNDSTFVGTKS